MSEQLRNQADGHRFQRRDVVILSCFCLLLFGFSLISGRPLSVHESVLPQSAREMLADGDWVVPKKGGTPWLESPPLPQWVTVSVAAIFGRCDTEWIVRLGPTLFATAVVLAVAWMACVWYGRQIGLLSGFVMATTCQFTRYSWLAEDEIYLCGVVTFAVALFVKLEFTDSHSDQESRSFFGHRSRWTVLLFVALGVTNLVKGLLFGTIMALVPIALFLICNHDWNRIRRYIWFWGWLIFAAITAAWPLAAYLRYPDVTAVWFYDLGGRLDGSYAALSEPLWYYPLNLLWMLLPWTVVIPTGLWMTRNAAWVHRFSKERFLWCWALGVPLVFSIPSGKHHHYLLHALAPWAVLGTLGMLRIREIVLSWDYRFRRPANSLVTTALPLMLVTWLCSERVANPEWLLPFLMVLIPTATVSLSWALFHSNPRLAARTLFGVLALFYATGHWVAGQYVDRHRQDVAFLKQVRSTLPQSAPILVDMNLEPLVGFLNLFYLDSTAVPLHNVSFAVDNKISQRNVFVLTRISKRGLLESLGTVRLLSQSQRTDRNDRLLSDRLSLFQLTFDTDISKINSEGVRISPMQAMHRDQGPYLRRL
ncbi:MAG: glycosyltransferase family 39 protein [Planctomycetaceae bacterium]